MTTIGTTRISDSSGSRRPFTFLDPISGYANLRTLYRSSSADDRLDGLPYWERMRARLRYVGESYGRSLETTVSVFCALSPNNSERLNLLDTEVMLRDGDRAIVHTYPAHRDRALHRHRHRRSSPSKSLPPCNATRRRIPSSATASSPPTSRVRLKSTRPWSSRSIFK